MTTQTSRLVIEIDSRNALRNAQAIGQELDSIEKKGQFASKSMDSMSVATRTLAGHMAGLLTIGTAVAKMDAYTGINNQLKLVTNSQVQLNGAMNETFAIAQRSRSSWESVTQVYQKLAMNAKAAGIAQGDIGRLTETISKGIALSGSSGEQASAAIMQLGQSLGAGKLSGDEFNSVMENGYGVMQLLAKGMNVPIGELKNLASEGKLTSEVVTKALLKMSSTADAEFAKTDATIGQSMTMLSNSVTEFTGEAGKASGAAVVLSGGIQVLANNLDLIADVAMIGGVAFLTKTIIAQTIAIQGSITASVQRRAAETAALQSQVQLAAIEVQRTRQLAALALTEVNLARAEYNNATTRTARAAATIRLTQAEIAHRIALNQTTAATVAQTAAENTLNASRALGTRMLALVGGPIGAITLGVTALAAGYMYFSNRAAEANKKLEEQAQVAKKAKEELVALKGLEKDKAVDDMTASFERQNKALSESSSKINMQLSAIQQLYKGNKEVVQVVQDARNGTLSMSEAVQRFNELRISKDVYNSVKANTAEFEKNAKEAINTKAKLNLFGIEVELAGKKSQTSAVGIDANTEALDKNETAAQKAAKAQKDFFNSLSNDVLSANENLAYLNLGFSKEVIEKIQELQKAKQAIAPSGTTAIVTTEEINQIVQAQKALDAVKDKEDEITAAKRKQTSELEKQQKILLASSAVQANAAKYKFSSLESKYSLPSGTLSAIHAIETGNTGKTNQVNKQSGATGGFQFLPGTAKQYGVKDRTNLAQSAEGAAKYMSYLLDLFKGDLEKAVRAYHAGEGNVQKGKNLGKYNNDYWNKFKGYVAGANGYSAGDINSKDFERMIEDATKMAEQQADLRKQLELNIANEVTKIRENLKDKLVEIDKAGFSPERTKELKAEYQSRADNEIAIAQHALKTKLDDYSSFKKTESQLLEDSFNEKKFYAARDIELTKEQRDKAVALLDEQLKQELALIKLSQETRLFQMREALMSETVAMQERYRLEREQILLNSKLSEEQKQREIALSEAVQQEEGRKRFNSAVQQWSGIQADMNGSSDQFDLDQERFNRIDASQALFDAELTMAGENYARREEAYLAHVQRMNSIETNYQMSSMHLQAVYGEDITSSMATMFKAMGGEQSKGYQVMYSISRGFAAAQAAISMVTNIAKASEIGFPQNIPMIAGAMAQGASIMAMLSGAQEPAGFATGGFTGTGGKFDPAGIVHKGEVVWSQEDIKRWGGVSVVEAMRTSQPPKGYSEGGLVTLKDTYRVGMGTVDAIERGADLQATRQAQANVRAQSQTPQIIDNQLRVVMVKDENEAKDMLYGPDGEKAFLYHMKRNRRKV